MVRSYPWLYDCTNPRHKDANMKLNSWTEIAENLGSTVKTVSDKWKGVRDRFARKLKVYNESRRSGAGASLTEEPQILIDLGWLKCFIKHRVTTSNFPVDVDGNMMLRFIWCVYFNRVCGVGNGSAFLIV